MAELMTFTCPVASMARDHPRRVGIRLLDGGAIREINYGELDETLDFIVDEVARQGYSPGARVGLLIDDPLALLLNTWGFLRAGCEIALISTRLPPGSIERQCDTSNVSKVVTDRLHLVGGAGRIVFEATSVARRRGAGKRGSSHAFPRSATIVFTSGSSGESKGALLSVAAHLCSAIASNENMTIQPGDTWALLLPQYHVSGLSISFRCFLAGATVAILTGDAVAGVTLADILNRASFTHISMVVTQLRRFVEDAERRGLRFNGLKLLVGGGAIPIDLLERAVALECRVYATYGMTEMASQITTTNGDGTRDELATSGRPLRYSEVRVDGPGQIHVRGETLFAGYTEGERIVRPFDDDGWFSTGDIGRIDAAGRLTVTGRSDRMFTSGGENINPASIEALIGRIEGVRRVAVVGVADEEYGTRPVAFVDPLPGDEHIARIRDTLSRDLPRYAVPTRYLAFPSDAETAISKIDYTRLVALANQSKSVR